MSAKLMTLVGKGNALLFRTPLIGQKAVRGQSRDMLSTSPASCLRKLFRSRACCRLLMPSRLCLKTLTLICSALLLLMAATVAPSAAQVVVTVDELSTLGGNGLERSQFLPGEEIRYRARISVAPAPTAPLKVSLRIMAEGWYEMLQSEVSGAGALTINWGTPSEPLYAATSACQGKAALHLSAAAAGEQVMVRGRRHGYLTVQCPADLPTGVVIAEIPVGDQPYDMAMTASGRFLYVTSMLSRIVTIVDLDRGQLQTVFPDWEEVNRKVEECRNQCPPGDTACREQCKQENEPLGGPVGVAPSPDGTRMLVADYFRRDIHTFNAATHEPAGDIPVNAAEGAKFSALAVNPNPARNEAFLSDYDDARLVRVGLAPPYPALELPLSYEPGVGTQTNDLLFHPGVPDFLFAMSAQLIILSRNGSPHYWQSMNFPVLSWSMALNPRWTALINPQRFLYVVLSPGGPPVPYPLRPESYVKVWDFSNSNIVPSSGTPFVAGYSLGDMSVRDDGRYAYAADSYMGAILLLDLERQAELRGCAIPLVSELLPEPVTARLLLRDSVRDRLYVATWQPGVLLIVQ